MFLFNWIDCTSDIPINIFSTRRSGQRSIVNPTIVSVNTIHKLCKWNSLNSWVIELIKSQWIEKGINYLDSWWRDRSIVSYCIEDNSNNCRNQWTISIFRSIMNSMHLNVIATSVNCMLWWKMVMKLVCIPLWSPP